MNIDRYVEEQAQASWSAFVRNYPVRFSRLLYNFYKLKDQGFRVAPKSNYLNYSFSIDAYVWATANLPVVVWDQQPNPTVEKDLIQLEQAVELAHEQDRNSQARAAALAKLSLEERRLLNLS